MIFGEWLWIALFHGLFFLFGIFCLWRIRGLLEERRRPSSPLQNFTSQARRVGWVYRMGSWCVLGCLSLSYYMVSLTTLFNEL